MVRGDRRVLLLLCVVSVGFAIAQTVFVLNSDLLLAVPPLLMLAPLVVGRYLGERTIARMRRVVPARRRPARRGGVPMPRAAVVLPRGGRLVAAALARRGPPAPLLAR